VRTILSQRLLRRPCAACRHGERLQPEEIARIGLDSRLELYRPTGCSECDFTGYSGRIGIHEALTVDDGIRAVLGGTASAIASAAVAGGTTFLYEQGRRLCMTGDTTVDEVVRVLGEAD